MKNRKKTASAPGASPQSAQQFHQEQTKTIESARITHFHPSVGVDFHVIAADFAANNPAHAFHRGKRRMVAGGAVRVGASRRCRNGFRAAFPTAAQAAGRALVIGV